MRVKIKSYEGEGFKAHIYSEILDTERFFIAWGMTIDGELHRGPRTLGPYGSFQHALNAVVAISSALKPVEVTVDIQGGRDE